MKNFNLIIVAAFLLLITSCKKDKPQGSSPVMPPPTDTTGAPPPIGDTVEIPLDDTARVLFKDMLTTNLPAPYYHFEYDVRHYATRISFASNFDIYDLTYSDKRLVKMANINNGNVLHYTYDNEKVSLITELTLAGTKAWEYHFEYNPLNQLTAVRWIEFHNSSTGNPFRKIVLSYHPDGNLAKLDNFFRNTNNQLEWSSSTEYKDYDNTVNVDDFNLYKSFFESLLYLPRVKFQKNNHHTEITTGVQNDYRTTYTYQYNNGLPVTENGVMVQTRGSNQGQTFNFANQFSYY